MKYLLYAFDDKTTTKTFDSYGKPASRHSSVGAAKMAAGSMERHDNFQIVDSSTFKEVCYKHENKQNNNAKWIEL